LAALELAEDDQEGQALRRRQAERDVVGDVLDDERQALSKLAVPD
jgi:hypothetical protein